MTPEDSKAKLDFVKPKQTSALERRPERKVQDDSTSDYILPGIKLVDQLKENRPVFNGWRNDPEACLVVEGLSKGQSFKDLDFSGVDFSGATLGFIDFSGADLKNANFAGVDFSGADLTGADLRGANLEFAILDGANLKGALLDGAYLKGTVIVGARLSRKALSELERMQQLQQEAEEGTLDLRKVNLKYLDLRRLDLRGVDLSGVDLSGVNLVGVSLMGAKVDPMFLDGSYAFKMQGFSLDIKKGNLAGANLTTVNFIKSQEQEREVLRQKRIEVQEIQQNQTIQEESLSALDLLKQRRQQQPSLEEMHLNIQDVVLNNTSDVKRLSTVSLKRPRRKEMLPPGEYDFPKLFKEPDEVDSEPSRTVSTFKEAVKVAEKVSYHVKKTWRKMMPRRSRIRQRS